MAESEIYDGQPSETVKAESAERGFLDFVRSTKTALRKNRHLRCVLAARRAFRAGLRISLARYRLISSILGTAPCSVNKRLDEQDVEVHLMCYWRDYLLAVWTLKTFYRFANVEYPLTIHIDGFVTRRMAKVFNQHFPGCTVIRQEEAERVISPLLANQGFHRLLSQHTRNVFVRKMVDCYLLSQSPKVLILDSDVLFFRRPAHLLDETLREQDALFMRDCSCCYTAPLPVIERVVGRPVMADLNCGVVLIKREALDVQQIESCLRHSELTAGDPAFLEQTLYAVGLCASRISYLPPNYVLSMEPNVDLGRTVARHYAGNSRELMTSEGIAYLIRQGFLTTSTGAVCRRQNSA